MNTYPNLRVWICKFRTDKTPADIDALVNNYGFSAY